MKPKLHIFPFSNYCELALWALDHAGIEYETKIHLPGPHARKIRKLSGQTAVPVLELADEVIAGSDRIAVFANTNSDGALIPSQHQAEIMNWHTRIAPLGATLRGLLFSDIFQDPQTAKDILTAGKFQSRPSIYGLMFRAMCPMLRQMVQREMTDPGKSRQACHSMLARISAESKTSGYLVGDTFTLADLTASAIFYPTLLPSGALGAKFAASHGGLTEWRNQWINNPAQTYLERIYRRHR